MSKDVIPLPVANPHLVEELEKLLEAARAGRVRSFAAVGFQAPGTVFTTYVPESDEKIWVLLGAVTRLAARINDAIAKNEF